MRLSMTTLVRALIGAGILAAWWAAFFGGRGARGGSVAFAMLTTFVLIVVGVLHSRWLKANACRVIRAHPFPSFLRDKLRAAHPQLDDAAVRQVERGLRQFFMASAQAGGRFVAMPSKVVDSLWHEYILYTRGYEAFCQKAFGRMLHEKFGLRLTQPRAIYGRPGAPLKKVRMLGNIVGLGELMWNNATRRKPYMLSYLLSGG